MFRIVNLNHFLIKIKLLQELSTINNHVQKPQNKETERKFKIQIQMTVSIITHQT